MNQLRRRLDRVLIRLLARRRGRAEAIRDLDYVREVLRFSALFSALVLLPMALLALLALRSLGTEELQVDVGLSTRAAAISNGVEVELDAIFDGFEQQVRMRLDEGDGNLVPLYDQLPSLRGIFKFDADGRLVEPFVLPEASDLRPEPSARYERALREALFLDAKGEPGAAVSAWSRALGVAEARAHRAEAAFGHARALDRAGDPRALDAYVVTAATWPAARDRNGFRVADLCTLRRASLLDRQGRAADADALYRQLVERSLASAWRVGLPGEAFTAREALGQLHGRVDAAWHRFASTALADRARLLHWASFVADELNLVANRPHKDNQFGIYTEENSLWITLHQRDTTHVFSFDYEALQRRLGRSVIDVANQVDPDLSAALVPASQEVGATAITRTSLAPRLPLVEVVVRPVDPEALLEQRRRNRLQRRLVILLAVAASLFGILAAVRVVNRQLDVARAKSDFAANVSHELRSPLTQIRLKAESLKLDLVFDEEDRREHYDAILHEAERLSRLVDNVLDFAAIGRGSKSYLFRPEDLNTVLVKATEAARPVAEQHGLTIELDLDDHTPVIWIDREAIAQVVINLLSNAIKYGADGDHIDVRARATEDAVEFQITDHGIGISAEDQRKIFDEFYRVSSADVRKRRGTGIGLTIVRYIVEAHGGTVGVESALGRGSTFTVTMPLTPPGETGG